METYLTAVGIILLGTLLQSATYVPISMVREWSWETFSFVRGLIIYVALPLWAANLALPPGYLFYELFDQVPGFQWASTIALGVVWGAADLAYERSMFYLGASRGKALSTGMTGFFGIVLAALVMHFFFYNTHPEWGISLSVIAAIAVALAGFYMVGKAGDHKDLEIHSVLDADRRHFNTKKGVLFALLGGIMGACLNIAMVTGEGIFLPETIVAYRWLPALFLFCWGAFASNTVICIVQNIRNHSFAEYSMGGVWKFNLIICALTGMAEFAALFAFCTGRTFLIKNTPFMVFAFLIMLIGQTLFGHMWELIVSEWRGMSQKTAQTLLIGVLLLLLSIVLPLLVSLM